MHAAGDGTGGIGGHAADFGLKKIGPAAFASNLWQKARPKWGNRVVAGIGVSLIAVSALAAGPAQDQSSSPSAPAINVEQPVPRRVRVSSGVISGLLITKVAPVYPKKARKKHIEGTVVLTATIDKQGNITDITVVSGDRLLAEASVDAVKQWKYRPYLFRGEAVEVETQIQVNFVLSGK